MGTREDLEKMVLDYKPVKRRKVSRFVGDKKSGVCPRCGRKGSYDFFAGRTKVCVACGFDTAWERNTIHSKREIEKGRSVAVPILRLCVAYINRLDTPTPKNDKKQHTKQEQ